MSPRRTASRRPDRPLAHASASPSTAQPYTGHAGDTLASALLANGVTLFGRSFKYHRPRGVLTAGVDEPNALVTVLRGEVREPNIPATMLEIYDGLTVVSQNRFPSLAFDVGAVNQLGGRLLGAGFYYKTFMGPVFGPLKGTRFWMFCEHFIRRAAGLGRAGTAADPARYERMNAFCDVLVVGSGPAGLMAAKAAADSGARVILAELEPRFGGSANWSGETIDGMPAADWAAATVAELAGDAECPAAAAHHRLGLLRRQHAGRARARHRPQGPRRQGRAAPSPLDDPRRPRRAGDRRLRAAAGVSGQRPAGRHAGVCRRSATPTEFGVLPGEKIAVFANNDSAYRAALALQRGRRRRSSPSSTCAPTSRRPRATSPAQRRRPSS